MKALVIGLIFSLSSMLALGGQEAQEPKQGKDFALIQRALEQSELNPQNLQIKSTLTSVAIDFFQNMNDFLSFVDHKNYDVKFSSNGHRYSCLGIIQHASLKGKAYNAVAFKFCKISIEPLIFHE